ncbi:MAG: hypothetical protein ACJ75Q_08635 [Gaiellaceae bacterium]
MACARLAAAVAAALAVALPTAAAHAAAPQSLHAFTLRADEAITHTFSRTPSFAWNPVAGAKSYDFELSTSRKFSDNGIVWKTRGIKSPAAALPLSLPWITGNPYSLYAHVRAITRRGPTAWSKPFGFNVRWPAVPAPLTPSYPGLLRWSKVAGASGYMVWLLDTGHWFTTRSNMADEREYYGFHQDPSWTSTVHWRVRPMRWLYGATDNGLPVVSYGPWSPVYTSYNPPFSSGPLTGLATVSDVVSDPTHTRTHETTPAFVYRGDTSIWRSASELYRVDVFTDEDCLNTVFRGAIVGSPAYVPREVGPLAMPTDTTGILAARDTVLSFGQEPESKTAEGINVTTNEMDVVDSDASHTGLPPSQVVKAAKVDLWDSDWAGGRYYWTVVPVHAVADAVVTTSLAAPASLGATTITVANATSIVVGDTLTIGSTPSEPAVVSAISGNVITLAAGLRNAYGLGDLVVRPSGGVKYVDGELTQDACASGRELTFAKASDPVVTGQAGTPFVSGLSPDGKLVSARKPSPRFYGQPLVAWSPMPSAGQYEVQWSKKAYPWATAGSEVTWSTSVQLPLSPGIWYYRVRGLDFLMMGSKPQMSWSDPIRLVVTKPRFRVVR